MQEILLVCSWISCQIGYGLPAISIDTPSKEHMDHFLIQKQLKQEMSSEECFFDNKTWDHVIEERKQEMRWEKRVEAYKAGLITTGLFVAEEDKNTHWTDRYSGYWFPHNFRRRRSAVDTAVADLANQYRVLEVLKNMEGLKRIRRSNVEQDEKSDDQQPAKSNLRVRRKRALAAAHSNKAQPRERRHLVERLGRLLLARQKRHLSERERELLDPYAFKAKDYNYYDYNNMLTAVTLASSTIKFVERCKKENPDLAQANDVHEFNRKHKNVFGGFHNDSEMLTFLRNYHYKNYTHEERKFAFFDDFMQNRVNDAVEFWKKNYENYKKHYRSFRERSNREGHRFVDPDTEDKSAIIPDFEEHAVLNNSELYRYFRMACEHADYKSSEHEPEPVNHYMPANHTDSPEDQVYRSGEVEAFQSDYENGRINTSCWTKFRKRRLASPPNDIRIDIKVINEYYPDENGVRHELIRNNNDRWNNGESKRLNGDRIDSDDYARDNGYKDIHGNGWNVKKEINKRITGVVSDGEKEISNVNERIKKYDKGLNVKKIDIMYQMDQNKGPKQSKASQNNRDAPVVAENVVGLNLNLSPLSKTLDTMKNNVDLNVVSSLLNRLELGQSLLREQDGGISGVFDMIANIVGGCRKNTGAKSFKVFEMYEIQFNSPSKKSSRTKRSVGGPKYLALNKVVKTIDKNDDLVLHLYLTPTDESEAIDQIDNQNFARSKRSVAAPKPKDDTQNENVEKPEDANECPLMKRVFYWKNIGEQNKDIVMSHEASVDAISMDDWNKRRDRHIKGITTKQELLEKLENEKEAKIREIETRLADERQAAEAAKNAPAEQEATEDLNACPLMKRVFYWKNIREQNNVNMSHEKSIDAVSMDDWHKRRDRHIAGYTIPGEDSRPEYEEVNKGKRIDPSKGEKLKRRKRENSEEVKGFQDPADAVAREPPEHAKVDEPVRACPLTFEPPKVEEEPIHACPLTFEPPKEKEPIQACPLTFEVPELAKDEPVQACPLTFESPKVEEEPIHACPLTFEPPKEKEPIQACPLTFEAPELPKDEHVQACLLTFEPPKVEEEPIHACPLTFEPPKEKEPVQACPLTFKAPQPPNHDFEPPKNEELVHGCPLTFKPPKKQEPIQGCPVTFSNPKALKEDIQVANPKKQSDHVPKAFWQKSFRPELAALEEKNPWAGFSEYKMNINVESTTSSSAYKNPENWSVRVPKPYGLYGYSPFVVSRPNTRKFYTQQTFEINPITKVAEPKFVRLIYNGVGYVRHVHFITNREFQKKKYVRQSYGVKNVYLENFLLERNETVKAIARAQHKVPRVIQNHYFDANHNKSRYINLYYDSEGDLTYTTKENNLRIPIMYRGLSNKHVFRSYYSHGMSRRTLTRLKEPVLVQLHYKF